MSGNDFVDDLLVRARREPLSEAEQRRLDDALSRSPEDRLLYAAGRAFDHEAPVQAGDDARIERMVAAVGAHSLGVGAARPRRRVAGALAVGLLLGSVAGAALELGRVVFDPAPVERADQSGRDAEAAPPSRAPSKPAASETRDLAPGTVELRRPAGVPPSERLQDTSARAPVPLEVVESMPDARERSVASPGSAASTATSRTAIGTSPEASFDPLPPDERGAVLTTASTIFAAANRARVSGDPERAILLYFRLESEFPRSSEALTARLSLGLLLLRKGSPEAALERFRAYQALGLGPTLVEAYWGEAQALRELGHGGEERAALERLVRKFPGSAYAQASANRLRELDAR